MCTGSAGLSNYTLNSIKLSHNTAIRKLWFPFISTNCVAFRKFLIAFAYQTIRILFWFYCFSLLFFGVFNNTNFCSRMNELLELLFHYDSVSLQFKCTLLFVATCCYKYIHFTICVNVYVGLYRWGVYCFNFLATEHSVVHDWHAQIMLILKIFNI